jgi:hypothetical protein
LHIREFPKLQYTSEIQRKLHGIHKAKALSDGEHKAEALNKIQTLEQKANQRVRHPFLK